MPPAGSGRPLHPCRLPVSSRRSLSDRKSFLPEAEGYRMQRHVVRSESHELAPISHWNQ
ncbi:MAG: hypothetical protein LBQ54_11230 [Planctomycetaceae bacterium]|nr:hypothetical protein [Planctomycetaceae bacterium]